MLFKYSSNSLLCENAIHEKKKQDFLIKSNRNNWTLTGFSLVSVPPFPSSTSLVGLSDIGNVGGVRAGRFCGVVGVAGDRGGTSGAVDFFGRIGGGTFGLDDG